ncbi:polyribonucleotide nucleotidyltransferase [Natronogracilivirga saccharolytica]|uniref:Polyribonucleotide nucleotidyltransferase n=1 Tax=Natronogracilivirga saccharolytica TaxID=2812953 RepID=A0A8J7RUF3_9BACT|nr:polyribonucleotide nucleotidyltransferase [Natronogracilivirga saccharolytica]MBP3193167.1 polyribonucleotide nucleotidyltransferase [Natronogracilivirga saccharolytica]
MKADFKTIEYAPGKEMTIDAGRLAKQANGSSFVRIGDTVVMATATSAPEAKPGQPFFPLTVEFKETYAAGGKFPGGFIKREGRPSEKEILSARLIDRTIRPLFPDGFMNETQVICQVFSSDGENDGDVIGAVAASLSLTISDIPFEGPMAQVRIARINGEFVVNPTVTELKAADLEMIVGGTLESVVMVEGEMEEVSEEDMVEAIRHAHDAIKKLCQFQLDVREELGKEKWEKPEPEVNTELEAKVREHAGNKFLDISRSKLSKKEYSAACKDVRTEAKEAFAEEYPEEEEFISEVCHVMQKEAMRKVLLEENQRIDGRKPEEIRPIWTEVGYLPRTHGSAIFTRGETQALASVTLGTKRDEQMIDTLFYSDAKRFMLDYNFPPFCTGEVKMMRGVSRREIGHGNLAERALKKMVPSTDEFDYTIRVVSDVLESNGSSSMATVCSGSMSLMDAGVPVKKPVAGIAMGMIVDENKHVVLSDIQGEEDHMGDMDFKVTGTSDGITACQMDIKVKGISYEVMVEALQQAREGRMHILEKMAESISQPRPEVSKYAPSFVKIEVDSDQIGGIIGPGGKVIQSIQRESGAEVMIEEVGNKGVITISADEKEKIDAAIQKIKGITGDLEEGEVYLGTVRSIKEYGAFVEIMPGRDGLLHISELDHKRINKVTDVLSEGDKVEVKLLKVEDGGKLRLSRKALIPKDQE